jgi:hypothetical protein
MGKLLSRSDSGDALVMQARMTGIIELFQQPDGTSHIKRVWLNFGDANEPEARVKCLDKAW